ncbi:MAG: methyltransferase domain-containing protein [bacterium]|nr:methyltransferase domain-containing protein [bacterium]
MLTDGFPDITLYEELNHDSLYQEMVQFSDAFVEANGHALDSYKSKWGKNPVRHCFRQWEYPWVYQQLKPFIATNNEPELFVFDAGSGLTFFPHYLISQDPRLMVICGDGDPQTIIDAKTLNPPAHSRARYRISDIKNTDFLDEALHAIYCISVIEHLGDPAPVIADFRRILKPGGRLILTIDVSLDGTRDIPLKLVARMLQLLEQTFTPDQAYLELLKQFDPAKHVTTDYIRKTAPDRVPWRPPRFHSISCFCMAYTKE